MGEPMSECEIYEVYADNLDTGERLYFGWHAGSSEEIAMRLAIDQLPRREKDWGWSKGYTVGDEVVMIAQVRRD